MTQIHLSFSFKPCVCKLWLALHCIGYSGIGQWRMEECFSTATTAVFSSVLQSTTFSTIHHTQFD